MAERPYSPREGERGFAAIAFVAALIVAGVAIAGFFMRSSGELDLETTLSAEKKLLRVRDALMAQAQAYPDWHFPCPDDPTVGENGLDDGCPDEISVGRVPWREIGLQENDVYDAWGRPFTYVVDRDAAETPYSYGSINVFEDDDRDPDTDPRVLTRNRDFALVDHGPNGLSAIGYGRNAQSVWERENADGDDDFYVASFKAGSSTDSFDDQVTWGALTTAVVTMQDALDDLRVDQNGNSRAQPNFTDPNSDTYNTDLDRIPVTTDTTLPDPQILMDATGEGPKSCFYLGEKINLAGGVIRTIFQVYFEPDSGGATGSRGDGMIALLLPRDAEDGLGYRATSASRLRCGDADHFGYYGAASGSDTPTEADPHRDASGHPDLAAFKIGLEFDTHTDADGTYQDPAQNHVAVLRRDPWHTGAASDDAFGGPSCTSVAEDVLDADNGPRDTDNAGLSAADAERVPPHACRWPFYDPSTITGDTAIPGLDWLEDEGLAVPTNYTTPETTEISDGWYKVRLEFRHYSSDEVAWDAGCRYDTSDGTLTAATTRGSRVDRLMVKAWLWNPVHDVPASYADLLHDFTGTTADVVAWHCLPLDRVHHDRVWVGFTQSQGSAAQGSQPRLRRFQLVAQ